MRHAGRALGIIYLSFAFLAACGGNGGGAPAGGAAGVEVVQVTSGDATVEINEFFFKPNAVTVQAGQTVVWKHIGNAQHTSTGDKKEWDSKPLKKGDTFAVKFNNAGTFAFHCEIHPSVMKATLTVR